MESTNDHRPTVLVVDDTPDNIALITTLLKDLYTVKIATNGKKALQIAFSREPIDLILLDIMMPEMDGYEVCRELKGDSHTADIPIIFLTAKSDEQDELKGFELGAVDYITKPISPPIVLARVRTHLRLKKITDYLKSKLEREDLW
jgi:putative two-component system response regulator